MLPDTLFTWQQLEPYPTSSAFVMDAPTRLGSTACNGDTAVESVGLRLRNLHVSTCVRRVRILIKQRSLSQSFARFSVRVSSVLVHHVFCKIARASDVVRSSVLHNTRQDFARVSATQVQRMTAFDLTGKITTSSLTHLMNPAQKRTVRSFNTVSSCNGTSDARFDLMSQSITSTDCGGTTASRTYNFEAVITAKVRNGGAVTADRAMCKQFHLTEVRA